MLLRFWFCKYIFYMKYHVVKYDSSYDKDRCLKGKIYVFTRRVIVMTKYSAIISFQLVNMVHVKPRPAAAAALWTASQSHRRGSHPGKA